MITYISDNVHENEKKRLSIKLDNELRTIYNYDDTYSEVSELEEKLDFIRLKHIYRNLSKISKDLNTQFYDPNEFGERFVNGTRFGYNRANYKVLIKLIKKYFYKVYIKDNKETELIEENTKTKKNILGIPFALTYINIYFELIYSDINDFFKYCTENQFTLMLNTNQLSNYGIVIVKNMCDYLLTRYGGLNNNIQAKENISIVLDKYFTDELKKIPETNFKRIIMKQLRNYFPHCNNDTYHLRALRNLSHGDFIPRKENDETLICKEVKNKNENPILYTIEDLIKVVDKLEINTDIKFINNFKKLYYFSSLNNEFEFVRNFKSLYHIDDDITTLIFLKENLKKSKNSSIELEDYGSGDRIDRIILYRLILISYYTFVQYNVQYYFKSIDYIIDDSIDWLNFNNFFVSRGENETISSWTQNKDETRKIRLYSKYEYFKHAFGHGNVYVNKSGIFGWNSKTDITFFASILDSIEFLIQPTFLTLMSVDSHIRNQIADTKIYKEYYLANSQKYWSDCQNVYEEILKNVQKKQEENKTQEYVSVTHL